jgi:hypothetical protein
MSLLNFRLFPEFEPYPRPVYMTPLVVGGGVTVQCVGMVPGDHAGSVHPCALFTNFSDKSGDHTFTMFLRDESGDLFCQVNADAHKTDRWFLALLFAFGFRVLSHRKLLRFAYECLDRFSDTMCVLGSRYFVTFHRSYDPKQRDWKCA